MAVLNHLHIGLSTNLHEQHFHLQIKIDSKTVVRSYNVSVKKDMIIDNESFSDNSTLKN